MDSNSFPKFCSPLIMEPTTRIELVTSPLPRVRSTTELRGPTLSDRPENWSGRRGSNSLPSAWKADALPNELLPPYISNPLFILNCQFLKTKTGGEGRIRTFEGISRQIYSLIPLATWVPLRIDTQKAPT